MEVIKDEMQEEEHTLSGSSDKRNTKRRREII